MMTGDEASRLSVARRGKYHLQERKEKNKIRFAK
jgi:hypothetical protein